MKKIILSICSLLIYSACLAEGPSQKVKCWIPGKHEKQESVVFKMENGKITYWDKAHIARPDAKSLFGIFSETIDESAIESVRFLTGRNGYAMVIAVTTAESVTVGISPDLKTGFYKYADLGSGNGDQSFTLECGAIR